MTNILIIDDEHDIRDLISEALKDEGYTTECAYNVESTLKSMGNIIPQLIILDIWLDGHHMDGMGLLKSIKASHPYIPIIMISGHASAEIAFETIKLGAYDFIEKPFRTEKLMIMVKRALEATRLNDMNQLLKHNNLDNYILIGHSKSVSALREKIIQVSKTNSRILITGESGVGKSLIARNVHALSKRANFLFIHLRTYNRSDIEIETELFGEPIKSSNQYYDSSNDYNHNNSHSSHNIHDITISKNSSHPYNIQKKRSMLELANNGTLFIDEITNLSKQAQLKLLEVIQNGYIKHSNHINTTNVDIRFIISSCRNIENAINDGILNENLHSRISTIKFEIQPLRNRKDDIIPLCDYFQTNFGMEFSVNKCKISDQALSLMMAYDWPGNIRQLRNTVERLLILATKNKTSEVTYEMLSNEMLCSVNDVYDNLSIRLIDKTYKDAKKIFETEYLKWQIFKFHGNIAKTAVFIGMDRAALHRKLRNLNLTKSSIIDDTKIIDDAKVSD